MKKIIVFSFVMYSCGNVQRVDTAAVKIRMAESKIMKINEEEIVNRASEWGQAISEKFNGDMNIECVDKLIFDNQEIELLDLSLVKVQKGKVGEILEAYKYGIENHETIGNNIQKLNDTTLLYTFPLKEKANLKTACSKDLGMIYFSKSKIIKSLK